MPHILPYRSDVKIFISPWQAAAKRQFNVLLENTEDSEVGGSIM